MSITVTKYQNQLPAICVDLADRTLAQIRTIQAGRAVNGTDTAFLENTFRLLEMYRSGNFVFDNPSGVLGGELSVPIQRLDASTQKKPLDLVRRSVQNAIRKSYGSKLDENDAVESLELVLGALAGYTKVKPQQLDQATVFFKCLKEALSKMPQPVHAAA